MYGNDHLAAMIMIGFVLLLCILGAIADAILRRSK